VTKSIPILIDCLCDAIDEQHRATNKAFFTERFVSYGDGRSLETALRSCLAILQPFNQGDSIPACYAEGVDCGSHQEAA
jgi:hypothetical protein